MKKYSDLGINENRIILEGSSKREEYLSSYNQVDIALSPFPYGGGTTTIEGLWMGVPAIVKKGNSFISRIGETIFYNTDFQDWIAKDNKDYISKAINFSSNLDINFPFEDIQVVSKHSLTYLFPEKFKLPSPNLQTSLNVHLIFYMKWIPT